MQKQKKKTKHEMAGGDRSVSDKTKRNEQVCPANRADSLDKWCIVSTEGGTTLPSYTISKERSSILVSGYNISMIVEMVDNVLNKNNKVSKNLGDL